MFENSIIINTLGLHNLLSYMPFAIKLKKTIVWLIWSSFFGLASFLLIFFVTRVGKFEIDLTSFVKDGTIMFFCGALLGEASIGIMQKEKIPTYVNNLAILSSLGLLGVISLLYLIMSLNPKSVSYDTVFGFLKFFIYVSVGISFMLKFIYFDYANRRR